MPDVMVVAAYGLILPQVVLDTPKDGCLNIHGSHVATLARCSPDSACQLLPVDAETGVTIMKMAAVVQAYERYSTGCPIFTAEETLPSLHDEDWRCKVLRRLWPC